MRATWEFQDLALDDDRLSKWGRLCAHVNCAGLLPQMQARESTLEAVVNARPESAAQMANEYVAHVWDGGPEPDWFRRREGGY